jgi:hypothetical protein
MSYFLDFCASLKPGKRRSHFQANFTRLAEKMIPLITVIKGYFILIHCVFLILRKGPKTQS